MSLFPQTAEILPAEKHQGGDASTSGPVIGWLEATWFRGPMSCVVLRVKGPHALWGPQADAGSVFMLEAKVLHSECY